MALFRHKPKSRHVASVTFAAELIKNSLKSFARKHLNILFSERRRLGISSVKQVRKEACTMDSAQRASRLIVSNSIGEELLATFIDNISPLHFTFPTATMLCMA